MKSRVQELYPRREKPLRVLSGAICLWIVLALPVSFVFGLEGTIGTHDPTTIMLCDGKYYAYGTGGNTHVSDDGWTWERGAAVPGGGGMGPDMIHIGDNYFMYVAGNVGGQPASRIVLKTTKSLNPDSPDYGWTEVGPVNTTDGVEFCNGIDPGCFLDPTTGKFWLTFGSYFGYIRVVELNPKTGMRIDDTYHDIAVNCEASTMIYHDGYYYLLATHGSCCRGSDSGYNIRVGRSKNVTGPFIDHEGVDMIQGGGKLLIGSGERYIGAGHFGHINLGNDVEKFSFHWEADLDRGGRSVLAIRPLLWKDGWPVAGDDFKGGTFEIESEGTGYALELGVEAVSLAPSRVRQMRGAPGGPGARGGAGAPRGAGAPGAGAAPRGGRGGFGGFGRGNAGPATPIPDQDVADVAPNWPEGDLEVRLGDYMLLAHQKWEITPAPDAGGYLGGPYFKITIAGTNRTLTKTDDDELIALPAFTGADEQLWRIDQLTDGTYRIMAKVESDRLGPVALTAVGVTTPSLAKFDPESDRGRWNLKKP